jgi:catechol 2,3-dioxygenase
METGRDAQGRVSFKAWDEHDHHSVVLRKTDAPGMNHMGFRVDSEDTLDRRAGAVEGRRLATDLQWIPAGELDTGQRAAMPCPHPHRRSD